MDVLTILLSQFLANPTTQTAVVGLVTKLIVDRIKPFLQNLDASGLEDKYKVPVGYLVVVCSALVSAANLALNHQLGIFDPTQLISAAVANLIATLGVHAGSKSLIRTLTPKAPVAPKK